MKSLNNRGQTLVLFVMLLPIMLLVMVLVFDIGKSIVEKQKLDNISFMIVSYGIEHSKDDNIEGTLKELVTLNYKDATDVEILVKDDYVSISLSGKVKGVFGNLVGKSFFEVRSYYIGNINDKKIKRVK